MTPELDTAAIRRAFDRAAAGYDRAAGLQRRVADQLLGWVDGEPARIVDAGCGTGYGTAALARRFPAAELMAFDLAPGMLRATRQRLKDVPLFCADLQRLPLRAACVDLLWSSLVLQWCERSEAVFAQAWRVLRRGGRFVFSSFGPATLHELRGSFADGRPHVSRFAPPEALERQLAQAGFAGIRVETRRELRHYPDVRSLMLELKTLGARNATAGRARGLTGRRGWAAMLAAYEARRTDAGLPATYELVYARAQR